MGKTNETICLTLTERCNFACAHCWADYGSKGRDIALSDALNCIQLAARRKVDAVFLTGGEPTLHPGFLKCIEKSVSLGIYTVLSSNGSFKIGRLRDMARAGLQELHVSYDKFHAPYITSDKVKHIIDGAAGLGIRPVLVIDEANSYSKYETLFGDYYKWCIPGSTFKPLVYVGRAVCLPRIEFESDILLEIAYTHGIGVYVVPGGRVSFCPVNRSLPSMAVDLASDWLDGVVETFRQNPTVKILVNEGVGGLLRRATGIPKGGWCSRAYGCNWCIRLTQGGMDWLEELGLWTFESATARLKEKHKIPDGKRQGNND